jgi:hypothetical protein
MSIYIAWVSTEIAIISIHVSQVAIFTTWNQLTSHLPSASTLATLAGSPPHVPTYRDLSSCSL